MTTQVPDEKLREILAGCEGVTPGPWKLGKHPSGFQLAGDGMWFLTAGWTVKDARNQLDAAHIARLDPATVSSIITDYLRLRELERRAVPAGAAGIKPLEWEEVNSKSEVDGISFRATAIGLRYYIFRNPFLPVDTPWSCYTEWYQPAEFGPFAEIDQAKAAAQADYEQRIRSALTRETEPGEPVSALLKAVDDILDPLGPEGYLGETGKIKTDALRKARALYTRAAIPSGMTRLDVGSYNQGVDDGLKSALKAVDEAREKPITSGVVAFVDGVRRGHVRSVEAIRAMIAARPKENEK